jgi:hypothetical protein
VGFSDTPLNNPNNQTYDHVPNPTRRTRSAHRRG